ncbi:hypothetical protein H8S90_09050 [Olivibacter sp. SDN3]|uniref:type VI secretion system tube protein TssD n=1 Tax=Olivibacter sp. SDN3 TaxID=2764720 RepID=UPI0016517847|nr:type VI secretion system tube protein TssD [Olivibacter sp. SDN3]QNL51698.1 hypothetical protein H8S90_09050 [Olivibacter sp. SDN3]
MKSKVCFLLLIFCCFSNINTFAQQAENEVKFVLTDPATNTSQTYQLRSVSYSCYHPSQDTIARSYDTHMVNIDFKYSLDSFLLKWIAGETEQAQGKITVENKYNGKIIRTIVFDKAVAGNASESFAAGDSYSSYGSTQISVYTRKLVIDDVVMDRALSSSR